jgi:hypothetical protein
MKKLFFLLLVLVVVAAVAYLTGTADGREQKDRILAKVKAARGQADGAADTASNVTDAVSEAATTVVDGTKKAVETA